MVLFHYIIEILDLAYCDRGAVLCIVALDRGFIRCASVDRDLLRHAMAPDRLLQKPQGSLLITLLGEEEIDGLALLVHRSIEVAPLPLDLDVGLIHPPTDPDGPLAAVKRLLQLRAVFDDPSVDRGVIDLHPALFHQFFDMTRAQRVGHIPADSHDNDILWEMGPLEADRHRRSPSLGTVGHREKPYHKSPQMKICDRTFSHGCCR